MHGYRLRSVGHVRHRYRGKLQTSVLLTLNKRILAQVAYHPRRMAQGLRVLPCQPLRPFQENKHVREKARFLKAPDSPDPGRIRTFLRVVLQRAVARGEREIHRVRTLLLCADDAGTGPEAAHRQAHAKTARSGRLTRMARLRDAAHMRDRMLWNADIPRIQP